MNFKITYSLEYEYEIKFNNQTSHLIMRFGLALNLFF
jgi:hypothetical protein